MSTPQKLTLPVKGQVAKVKEFDSAKLTLSWINKAGQKPSDMDAMIFGKAANGKSVGCFSKLYGRMQNSQGRLDDFPYMQLDQDAAAGVTSIPSQDEPEEENITIASLSGHKELYALIYNYSAARGQLSPSPFKAWGVKATLELFKEGESIQVIDVPLSDDDSGIAVQIAKIEVNEDGNKISNATRIFKSETELKEVPGIVGTFIQ